MMKTHLLRKAVLLSVLFHLILLGGTLLLSDRLKPPSVQVVSIDFLSSDSLEKAKLAQKLPDQLQNQVVEQSEESANDVVPENARFLSAKNQMVKKQTIAVNKGDFQNTQSKSQLKPGATRKQITKSDAATKDKVIPIKNLFSSYDPVESLERQHKAQETKQVDQTGTDGAQGSGAVSQSNDYAKDVDRGLETLLNTREFKYYSYYTRIRRQLAQHWEGKVREKLSKMYKENRAPANVNEDRITKVVVVLNSAGTLVNVQIVSDSGLRDLDDAAVEAFRAAAPFPNPPKGIIEDDGTVKIRWDFVLES